MGMAGGTVRASVALTARGEYPPDGVVPETGFPNTRVTQTANEELTPLEFGTGPGTADKTTVSNRAIPAGSSVTYDLYTGTDLKDLGGLTCAFRVVRMVKISIVSGGASGVRVGGASSNEFVGWFAAAGDKSDIFPGGPPFWQGDPEDGEAVTSSAKNLKIENLSSSAECVVRVVVAGSAFTSGMAMGPVGLTYP